MKGFKISRQDSEKLFPGFVAEQAYRAILLQSNTSLRSYDKAGVQQTWVLTTAEQMLTFNLLLNQPNTALMTQGCWIGCQEPGYFSYFQMLTLLLNQPNTALMTKWSWIATQELGYFSYFQMLHSVSFLAHLPTTVFPPYLQFKYFFFLIKWYQCFTMKGTIFIVNMESFLNLVLSSMDKSEIGHMQYPLNQFQPDQSQNEFIRLPRKIM